MDNNGDAQVNDADVQVIMEELAVVQEAFSKLYEFVGKEDISFDELEKFAANKQHEFAEKTNKAFNELGGDKENDVTEDQLNELKNQYALIWAVLGASGDEGENIQISKEAYNNAHKRINEILANQEKEYLPSQ